MACPTSLQEGGPHGWGARREGGTERYVGMPVWVCVCMCEEAKGQCQVLSSMAHCHFFFLIQNLLLNLEQL